MFRILSFLMLSVLMAVSAKAQLSDLSMFDMDNVVICPASMSDTAPPDFTSAECSTTTALDIDPQGALIWVKTTVSLAATRGADGEPLSIYISGKQSSEVYLNGVFIGANGKPGNNAAGEIPGRMDAELFPPQNLFRVGANEIVFRASAHHGVLHLYRPMHWIGIAPAGVFGNGFLLRVGLPLITLGLFLVGWIYFGIMAFIGMSRVRSATLSAVCFFAGGQLVSETLRALVPYSYPVHDIRLIAIAFFSLAFGLTVTFHIFRNFMQRRVLPIMAGLTVVCVGTVFFINGFDYKALAGLTVPLAVSLIATGIWSYQRQARAFLYFVSLLIFLLTLFVFQGFFLDAIFFLLVALLLLLLFVDQAFTLGEEARERRSEEARANRLEQALAEAEERTDASHINVKSAGKVQRIATSEIVRCQGAGGYSEIMVQDGRTLLHAVSLNDLEEQLPATFLRVHRSHLINVMFVQSLSRDPSGTGTLTLSKGDDVPVSRRVMPKVRKALG